MRYMDKDVTSLDKNLRQEYIIFIYDLVHSSREYELGGD